MRENVNEGFFTEFQVFFFLLGTVPYQPFLFLVKRNISRKRDVKHLEHEIQHIKNRGVHKGEEEPEGPSKFSTLRAEARVTCLNKTPPFYLI